MGLRGMGLHSMGLHSMGLSGLLHLTTLACCGCDHQLRERAGKQCYGQPFLVLRGRPIWGLCV